MFGRAASAAPAQLFQVPPTFSSPICQEQGETCPRTLLSLCVPVLLFWILWEKGSSSQMSPLQAPTVPP